MYPKPIKDKNGCHVNFRWKERRIRKIFSKKKYPNPSKAAEDFITQILDGSYKEQFNLKETVEKYLKWAELTGAKKPSTLISDRQRLKTFSVWANNSKIHSLEEITLNNIRDFQMYYLNNAPLFGNKKNRKSKNKYATWHRYYHILSAFFSWCEDREYLENNFLRGKKEFKIKIQQTIPQRIFSKEELYLIFDEVDKVDSIEKGTFFRLLAYTGLRAGEAINLEWGSIDLKSQIIRIEKDTKNKKVRTIHILPQLMPSLKGLQIQNDYLFNPPKGGSRGSLRSNYYRFLQRILIKLKLERARLHDFRHTFASHLIMAGAGIEEVGRILGHGDIKTTMIYSHFFPKHIKETIKKLNY